METDRRKWRSLKGINLFDGLNYQITMSPTGRQDKVVPESFRIILRQIYVPVNDSLIHDTGRHSRGSLGWDLNALA